MVDKPLPIATQPVTWDIPTDLKSLEATTPSQPEPLAWERQLALIKAQESEQARFLQTSGLPRLQAEAQGEGPEAEEARRLAAVGENIQQQFQRLLDERHQLAIVLHQLAVFVQRPDVKPEHIVAAAKHGEQAAAGLMGHLTPVDVQAHTTIIELRNLLANGNLNRLGSGMGKRAKDAIRVAIALVLDATHRQEQLRLAADGYRRENERLRREIGSSESSAAKTHAEQEPKP